MSVKPTSTFGDRFNIRDVIAASNQADADDSKSSEFYLNTGYEQNDDKYPFVSLGGIGLDHERKVKGTVRDRGYAAFLKKQNALREMFLERAQQLAPGEAIIVSRCEATGMCLELRRRGNEIELTDEEMGDTLPPIKLLA